MEGNALTFDKPKVLLQEQGWAYQLDHQGVHVEAGGEFLQLTDVPCEVTARWRHVQSEQDQRYAPKMGVFLDFYRGGTVVNSVQVAYDDIPSDKAIDKIFDNLGYSVHMGKASGFSFGQCLRNYLKLARPPTTYNIHTKSGWSDDGKLFVAGSEVVAGGTELDIGDSTKPPCLSPSKGTIADWQQHVAQPLIKQQHACYQWAVSLPLGAALMPLVGFPLNSRGGFHLFGDSSTGKSMALRVACSVLGDSPKTWETTSSKLELVASEGNHRLLCLDEIGQANKKEVVASAYKLAAGEGKNRTNANMEDVGKFTFELLFLSTGEASFADVVLKETKEAPYAGQKIRFCDILYTDKIAPWWDSSTLRQLDDALDDYRGVLGREFLRVVAATETKASLQKQYRAVRDELIGGETNSKFCRVANRFALCILGARIAKKHGLLPDNWNDTFGPKAVYEAWKDLNGEIDERTEAAQTLSQSIEKGLSNSRFHTLVRGAADLVRRSYANDVMGFMIADDMVDGRTGNESECLIYPDTFLQCLGDKNPAATKRYLAEQGVIIKGKRGYTTRMARVTHNGMTIATEKTSVYHISLTALSRILNPEDP